MRLTDLKVSYLKVPIREPGFRGNPLKGFPAMKAYPLVIVRAYTDDEGMTGVGGMDGRAFWKAGISGWAKYLSDVVKPMLLKEIQEPFYNNMFMRRIRSEPPNAISPRPACVEMALWDIVGKALKTPVYKIFGATKDKVKAYVNAGPPQYPPWTPEKWADFYVDRREEGYKAVKMFFDPSFQSIESIVETTKVVRDSIGHEMEIMVDACSAWGPEPLSFHRALMLARGLERYDVAWLEEPLPHILNPELSARLARMVDIPIAGGGTIFGIHNYRMLLEKGALDIVQPDAGFTGLSEVKKIAEMAEYYGKSCVPHAGGPGLVTRASLHVIGATDIRWCESHLMPPRWTVKERDSILKKPTLIDKDG